MDTLTLEGKIFAWIFILGSFYLGFSCLTEVLKSLCFPEQFKLFFIE